MSSDWMTTAPGNTALALWGRGEGAFRALIERVLALGGRWKVVASIRTFDLRMGIRFRELFPGQPPDADYRDPTFPKKPSKNKLNI